MKKLIRDQAIIALFLFTIQYIPGIRSRDRNIERLIPPIMATANG
jgi:hypothetical protein